MVGTVRHALSGLLTALSSGYILSHAVQPGNISWQEWVLLALAGGGVALISTSLAETYRGWRYVVQRGVQGNRRVTSLGSMRDAGVTLLVQVVVLVVNITEMFRHESYPWPNWLGWMVISVLASAASWARRRDRRLIFQHSQRNEETKLTLTKQMVDRGIPIPPEVVKNLQEDGLVSDHDELTPPGPAAR